MIKQNKDLFDRQSFRIFFANLGVDANSGEKIDKLLGAALNQFELSRFFNDMDSAITRIESQRELNVAIRIEELELEVNRLKTEIENLKKQKARLGDILYD